MVDAESPTPSEHADVLIIGAGISGIGIACHLKSRRPGTSFAILERSDRIGGTWRLFRYPGIRSDSDMPTFGFGFKPWTHERALADAHVILDYLQQTVDENQLSSHLRFGVTVDSANFDSTTGMWTITAMRDGSPVTFTSRFLIAGTGYYDHESAFTPDFDGVSDFTGQVIHPQFWPEDLDYTGKRVVVIGSGATAVTLIPAMAGTAEHVTMLQRSPSYVISLPAEDQISNRIMRWFGPERGHRIVRRKNIATARAIYKACMRWPEFMRRLIINGVRKRLPEDFDVDTHFTPRYNPWEERLCMVPNGDLFKAIRSGSASVVTDRIARFTPDGILLESGEELRADVIVTATGLNLLPFGRIRLNVDGQPVNLAGHVVYRTMMLSGVPNFVYVFGYFNISWTLKVDIVAVHLCRLLDHMDARGYDVFEPVFDDAKVHRVGFLDVRAGYVQRGIGQFPKAGDSGDWAVVQAYEVDKERLLNGPVEDADLHFSRVEQKVAVS